MITLINLIILKVNHRNQDNQINPARQNDVFYQQKTQGIALG